MTQDTFSGHFDGPLFPAFESRPLRVWIAAWVSAGLIVVLLLGSFIACCISSNRAYNERRRQSLRRSTQQVATNGFGYRAEKRFGDSGSSRTSNSSSRSEKTRITYDHKPRAPPLSDSIERAPAATAWPHDGRLSYLPASYFEVSPPALSYKVDLSHSLSSSRSGSAKRIPVPTITEEEERSMRQGLPLKLDEEQQVGLAM